MVGGGVHPAAETLVLEPEEAVEQCVAVAVAVDALLHSGVGGSGLTISLLSMNGLALASPL